MRPSVSRPTGTVIGAPVSMAFMPRTMPSVGFMAMQRTWFSPMWFGHLDDDVDGHLSELAVVDDANGVVDRRQMSLLELDVDGRSDDLDDLADRCCVCRCVRCHVRSPMRDA